MIRYYLPADIVTLLDLTTVQIAKDSFVDKELQTHFSDLLYQVQTNDGNPAYVYTLFDHKSYSDSDDEIRGTILLRVTLLLFKYVLREDLREHLPEILNLLNQLADQRTGLEYLETALRYLYHGAKAVTLADLRSAVEQVFREGGELMATIAEGLMEQGRIEGRVDGLREGILESIGIVLELKFGPQGLQLLSEIEQIADVDLLRQVQKSLRTVVTVAQVRAIYQAT